MNEPALSNDSQSTAETQVNRKPLTRYFDIMTRRRDSLNDLLQDCSIKEPILLMVVDAAG